MKLTLKSLRANKNMTQVEAAKAIGVGKETWRNYENGKTYPDVLTPLRELRKCLMWAFLILLFCHLKRLNCNRKVTDFKKDSDLIRR